MSDRQELHCPICGEIVDWKELQETYCWKLLSDCERVAREMRYEIMTLHQNINREDSHEEKKCHTCKVLSSAKAYFGEEKKY